MSLRKLKSRQRMMIRLGAAMLVVLALGGWLTAQAVQRELQGRIDEQLRTNAAETSAIVELLDTALLENIAAQFDLGTQEWTFVLLDPDGTQTTLGAGANGGRPLPDVLDTPIAELRGRAGEPFTVGDVAGGEDSYRVLTMALADGRVGVVGRTMEPVQAVLHIVHKTFLVAFIGSVVALGLLVWVISRQVLKPLEDVVETAHLIGEGSLNTRVEVTSTATDIERLADALNAMLARLQTAFDNKERSEGRLRQFVSDASHELRTPLAAILGYAELYDQRMARSPEQVDDAMRHIAAEGARMRSLVEDLLLLARLDEGRPLARDAVDLTAVVEDSVAAIRTIDGDHTFSVDAGPDVVEVVGDGLALRQVVDNLLTNVVTHTPPGTATTVTVGPAPTNGSARVGAVVTVEDDGPGMSPEHADKVFDRFFRAEQARTRPGGSGLGLAIVDEIVRGHGGCVTVRTAPGQGAAFEVRLP